MDKEDFDDFEFDDLVARPQRKKRKNIKDKGDRGAYLLIDVLQKRFKMDFSKTLGSGNRWGQVPTAKPDYVGDLVVPDIFRFTIEIKNGYQNIDLKLAITKGQQNQLDDFLKQVSNDSKRAKKPPLLCWKKDRQPWIAFVRPKDVPEVTEFENRIHYRGWVGVALKELLSLPDEVFLL